MIDRSRADAGTANLRTRKPGATTWTLVGVLTLVELAGGVLLSLLADALSRSSIGGDGWSLRGNGALIVPVAGGPGILTAGWAMLVVWPRGLRRRVAVAVVAGIVALVLELVAAFVPLGYARQPPQTAAATARVFLLGVMPVLSLLAGAALARLAGRLSRRGLIAAAGVWLVIVAGGLRWWGLFIYIVPLLLPLLLLTPLLVIQSGQGRAELRNLLWLVAGCVVLVLGFFAGLAFGAIFIVASG